MAIVFGCAFLWLVFCLLDSKYAGSWGSFAKVYPAQDRPDGNSYFVLDCRFAKASRGMKGARVVFTGSGIYFYMTFFSRPGHPPFLLPWDSIKSVSREYGFLGDYYRIYIQNAAGEMRADLPLKAEQDLSRYHHLKPQPENQLQHPTTAHTIQGIPSKIGGVLLLAVVIYWLGYSLNNDDLVLPGKHSAAHFHGLAAWIEAGAVLCFAILGAGFLIIPAYRGYRRSLLYAAWALFFIGLVVGIWRHGK